MALTKFDEKVFKDVLLGRVSLSNEDQIALRDWWLKNDEVDRLIRRFELAVANCHAGAERSAGNKITKTLRKTFNETNLLFSKLLGLKTNFFMELWYWPVISNFKTRPEAEIIEKILAVIADFEDIVAGNEDDQVLAVLEVLADTPANKTQEAKEKMLQWSCEEFLRLYEHAKLNYLAGLEPGTTIDDLETEKVELRSATNSELWKYKEKQKVLRKLKKIREAMDAFCVDTQAKIDMRDLIRYLSDGFSRNTPIWDLLQNTENMFQTLISDSTQQEFWDWETEEKEE